MYHLLFPIIMNSLYVKIPKKELQKIQPDHIYSISLFHNYFLHIYSLYTFVQLLNVLIKHGVTAKSQLYFSIPGVDRILFLFYMSKYYEFVDTFILYAKGREPIYLQKFHHMGANLMWHLGYVYKFDGIFFASLLNSGVHSVMYFYYFCSMFPTLITKIRKYKIFITCIQVGQLAYGAIALPWYYYNIEKFENKVVIIIFDVYISILLCLFGHFMFVNYFSKNKKDPKSKSF